MTELSSLNEYDFGTTVRLSVLFQVGATPTNPTTVSLTITKPDATTSSPSPVSDGSGAYHYDVVVDQAGEWIQAWAGTGACAASEQSRFAVRRSGA